MRKSTISLALVGITVSLLLSACSGDDQESTDTVSTDAVKISKPTATATATTVKKNSKKNSRDYTVMDIPVDFSTPENITKSIKRIQADLGHGGVDQLNSAVIYLNTHDASLGKNRSEVFKNLSGKTPNEIIAMANELRK